MRTIQLHFLRRDVTLAPMILSWVVVGVLAGACSESRGPAAGGDTTVVALIPPDSVQRSRADSIERLARDSAARVAHDSVLRASPGYVVDSALAPEEALRRFRRGVPPVDRFEGGAPSLDSLVALFGAAAARSDRAALEQLAVTRAEYAWIIFPLLPLGAPPYRQPPDVEWMLQQGESRSGLTRLLDQKRRGPIRIRGYRCDDGPTTYGLLRAWPHCVTQRLDSAGTSHDARLFGSVVEYRGRFKLLSFSNDF